MEDQFYHHNKLNVGSDYNETSEYEVQSKGSWTAFAESVNFTRNLHFSTASMKDMSLIIWYSFKSFDDTLKSPLLS